MPARPIQIAPSVLPVDFSRFGEECLALEKAGVDRMQFDVMDGRFVPNLTFGPDVIASVRPLLSVPFEAHLMVEEPDQLASRYVEAGCERLIVHAEACLHLHRVVGAIRDDLGAKAAVALNPATPISAVAHVLDLVDMVLVMTVNPGFGGQRYIATMEPKVAELHALIVERGVDVDIEVDGGISVATVAGAASAGANVLVAGSALFADPAGLDHAVTELRATAEAAPIPIVSASTTTTRDDDGARPPAETDAPDPTGDLRTRRQVRWLSGLLAVALVGVAAFVLTRHDPPARTAENFCHQMQAARHVDTEIATANPTRLAASAKQLTAASRVAPSAIQGPMNVVVGYLDGLVASVHGAKDPDQALRAEVAARASDNATVARAGEAVSAYVSSTCGFALTTTSTTG